MITRKCQDCGALLDKSWETTKVHLDRPAGVTCGGALIPHQAPHPSSPLDLEKMQRLTAGKRGAIATSAGITQANLSRILHGKTDARVSTIAKIADAMKRNVRTLFR